ncbi:MAG TPA: AraC family transcriptional regulator [Vicinamibacterales bacterium]|nr:AraC family transcriptional regulator [Vicinamibacterales bacterium]
MLLFRSLTDISSNNGELPETFRAKWDREDTIIWGRSRHASFGPHPHTLSIRAVWGGTQYCHLDGRTIAVDDDNYLILNHGRTIATSIRAAHPVESLTICFRPESVGRVFADAGLSTEKALDRGGETSTRPLEFLEHLQPHDGAVSPVLRFIRAHLSRGLMDEAWYEEHLVFLLERMRTRKTMLSQQIDQLALIRPATRREAYRRIGLATDYLHSHYSKEVDLGTLAGMAYLSKYHFLRLFTLIHGVTPRNYLQRKRANVAIRLLASTKLAISEVTATVGFADQSTLLRHVRRLTKLSPRQIRAGVLAGAAA